jgi:thiol-disulfide isomerase/thioredoxin
MAPAYERAAAELEPDYRLLKVNAEEEPALAERYQVRAIPTMMMFARDEPVAQTAGAMSAPRDRQVGAHSRRGTATAAGGERFRLTCGTTARPPRIGSASVRRGRSYP